MRDKLEESTEEACVRVMAKLDMDPQVTDSIVSLEHMCQLGTGSEEFRKRMFLTLLGYVYWIGHADASLEHLQRLGATVPVRH